jgi:hypothetical protein
MVERLQCFSKKSFSEENVSPASFAWKSGRNMLNVLPAVAGFPADCLCSNLLKEL